MNTNTKLIGVLISGFALGCVVGLYFEYTFVSAKKTRQLLKEYRYVRDNFHLTDAEMTEFGKQAPQYFEEMKAQDRMAAFMALVAFKELKKGDIAGTKIALLRPIGGYYRVYGEKGGDPDIIAAIKEAGKEYSEVAAEIGKDK